MTTTTNRLTAVGLAGIVLGVVLLLHGARRPEATQARPASAAGSRPVLCSIRESDCQRQLWARLATRWRGAAAGDPPRVVFAPAQEVSALGRPAASPADSVRAAALALLALAPIDARGSGFGHVAGDGKISAVYLPAEDRVVVADGAHAADSPAAHGLLTHELVHALQSRAGTVGEQPTTDAALAARAWLEGAAVYQQYRVKAESEGFAADDFHWDDMFGEAVRQTRLLAATDGGYARSLTRFGYAYGGLLASRRAGRFTTTRSILVAAAGGQPPSPAVRDEAPRPPLTPPDGLRAAVSDSLGAWAALSFFSRRVDIDAALAAATGVAQDRMVALTDDNGTVAVVWELRSVAPLDARLFAPRAGAAKIGAASSADRRAWLLWAAADERVFDRLSRQGTTRWKATQ